jgi:hypothetical protein
VSLAAKGYTHLCAGLGKFGAEVGSFVRSYASCNTEHNFCRFIGHGEVLSGFRIMWHHILLHAASYSANSSDSLVFFDQLHVLLKSKAGGESHEMPFLRVRYT